MKKHQLLLFYFSIVICGSIFVCACANDKPQAGVVAMVNGAPVFLKDIEYGYDANFFEWSDAIPPSARELKNKYGQVLLDLIVIELIRTELDARNLTVTKDEIMDVENEIRKDYPEGEFEKMLIEEYIDLQYWRTRIGHKLMWEKFVDKVLMAEVSFGLDEINDYYYSNIQEFYVPDRLVYLYIESIDREILEHALDELEKYEDVDILTKEFQDASIARYEMRVDQLPQTLAEDLQFLEAGQSSEIKGGGQEGFYILYLVEKKEEQLLKPHQVYTLIEQNIVNSKLTEIFNNWISDALGRSQIEINTVLLENIIGGSN